MSNPSKTRGTVSATSPTTSPTQSPALSPTPTSASTSARLSANASSSLSANTDVNYHTAFDAAPVGMALSRSRTIVDCNQALCEMFGATRSELVGQSFEQLYPSADEFERTGQRIAPLLNAKGTYSDNRIMRRLGGRLAGQTFWCHVTGRALVQADPHAAGIWCFEDLSQHNPMVGVLTPREREVAALLVQGLTSKAIGKILAISHRTVDIYRAKLMRKYQAHTTAELVSKLAVWA